MSRRTVGTTVLDSCERIRPERPRNAIQRLVWAPGTQFAESDDDGSNPRTALRRLLRLYEGRQYREAARFVGRLPGYALRAALPDIPMDLLIERLPQSSPLLDALVQRIPELGLHDDAKLLRLELLLPRLVGLVARAPDASHLRPAARILPALHRAAPSARGALVSRQRALERAVEGLGRHGLVSTEGSGLVPLRVALKHQLEACIDACKLALQRIDALGKHKGGTEASGVQAASHQRQLSLGLADVERRLRENRALVESVERVRAERLDPLLAELRARVHRDEDALGQWAALAKSDQDEGSLAAVLLGFARGCAVALQLMHPDHHSGGNTLEEEGEEDDGEGSSSSAGYHTDESSSRTPEPLAGLCCPDTGAERLRERYAALYSHAGPHFLQPLAEAPQLKAKILFSVVVLSWRLAGILQASRRVEALKMLNGGGSPCSAPPDLEECIRRQMATVGAQSGAHEVARQVTAQLQRTLHDFPCVRNSSIEIGKYALWCSRLAWACLARSTPLVLDVSQGSHFRPELHVRQASGSGQQPSGDIIKAVLWPGLRLGCQGPCLHRAVVLTSSS